MFAFERGAELADDAGLAHGLDVVAAEQVAFEIQHPPRGVVHQPQPPVAVDDEHAFDHARQDGRHARAIGLELVQRAATVCAVSPLDASLEPRACAGSYERRADPVSPTSAGRHRDDEIHG